METHNTFSRGYVLAHRDVYEDPDEPDMLHRNAVIWTLHPEKFSPRGNARIVQHSFIVLEPPDVIPFAFTLFNCMPIAGQCIFDSLEAAQNRLNELGVPHAQVGFNPIK